MKHLFVTVFFVCFSLASLLAFMNLPLPHVAVMAILWLGTAALAAYAAGRKTLTSWILASMFIGGIIGAQWPHFASHLQVLSQIFLRLIKTIIAPLIFGTLVSGIAAHADFKKVGRLGLKSLIYFEVVTTFALIIGLAAINLSQAGTGIHLPELATAQTPPIARPTASDILLHIFPENLAKSVADGQVLQVVIFSLLFGIALMMVREEHRAPMLRFCESLTEVMFKFTNLVMLLAPLGVGAAMAYTISQGGITLLGNLARLLLTLYAALIVFVLLVLLPIARFAGVPLRRFLRAVAEPVTIAFSTANSEAALPRAMESMEEMGVPRSIVAFVMPTGYSFNLDGSTLYLAVAAMFVAQAAGIHLGLKQQLVMMLMLMLTSKGVAGVSRASLVILLATADQLGLPLQPILLLFGIDQLMDMARTSVNVFGNCLATAVVARWEGESIAPQQAESNSALAQSG